MNNLKKFFPVSLSGHWQSETEFHLEGNVRDWLLEPSSLTARLKERCREFRVEVLGQAIESCSAEESNYAIKQGEQVLVREVLLYCDEVPQVFARSLLPLSSLTGDEQQLANLGEQPLGQVLFNNPNLKRSLIEVASFQGESRLHELIEALSLDIQTTMWGRRSLFFLHEKPLMVAEVFLPNAFAYQSIGKAS